MSNRASISVIWLQACRAALDLMARLLNDGDSAEIACCDAEHVGARIEARPDGGIEHE